MREVDLEQDPNILNWVNEVSTLPIGEAAQGVETDERILFIADAIADRALDIATDPGTPQGQVPDALGVYERATNVETLTPEEQEFKESLLGGFNTSYDVYTSTLDVMNAQERRINNPLEQATEEKARQVIEELLTPGVIREAMANVAAAEDIPENEEYGLIPRARVALMVDQNTTAADETVAAEDLQAKFEKAYSGDDYLNPDFHNESTAHKATRPGAIVRAEIVFDHLNLPSATATEQKTLVDTHNEAPDTETKYKTGDNMVFVAHINQLVAEGLIDTTTESDVIERFYASYYRNVSAAEPGVGRVSGSCVYDDAQVCRDYSGVRNDNPSRASLVSTKIQAS